MGDFFGQIGSLLGSVMMYGIGFVIVMLFLSARKQGGWSPGPALVLKKFVINKAATGQVALVDIVGRQGGLIAWFLTLIGLDTTSTLKVTATEFSLRNASLFGQQHSVIAISSISSVHCGYRKPISYFFISATCLLLGLGGSFSAGIASFFGGIILAAIFFVLYFLNKSIVLYVIPRAGFDTTLGLAFKRSVIENVDVDIPQVELAIGIINTLVIKSQNIVNVETSDVMESAVKHMTESKSAAQRGCSQCGKPLEEGERFCTSCGHGV